MRWMLAVWMLALATFVSVPALAAYTPPPIGGYVTDAAGKLTPQQISALEMKLAAYRQCSTNHVVVFYPKSLDGNSIEQVAYRTFNTWHIGDAQKDNGVLLVLAPNERQIRIEVGKGVESSLTDVEASHILSGVVGPNMKADNFFGAADQGTTRIGKALGGCPIADISAPGQILVTTTMTPASTTPKPNAPVPQTIFNRRFAAGLFTFMFIYFAFMAYRSKFHGVVLGLVVAFAAWFITFTANSLLHTTLADYFQWTVCAASLVYCLYAWWLRARAARDPNAPPLVAPFANMTSNSSGGGYSGGSYGGGGGYSGGGGGGGGYGGGGGSSGGGGASGGY